MRSAFAPAPLRVGNTDIVLSTASWSQQPADCVVNVVSNLLSIDREITSQLSQVGGQALKDVTEQGGIGTLGYRQLTTDTKGHAALRFNYVVHVVSSRIVREAEADFSMMMRTFLRQADLLGCRSVVVPPMTSPARSEKGEVKAMVNKLASYLRSSTFTSLRLITIHFNKYSTMRVFQEAFAVAATIRTTCCVSDSARAEESSDDDACASKKSLVAFEPQPTIWYYENNERHTQTPIANTTLESRRSKAPQRDRKRNTCATRRVDCVPRRTSIYPEKSAELKNQSSVNESINSGVSQVTSERRYPIRKRRKPVRLEFASFK